MAGEATVLDFLQEHGVPYTQAGETGLVTFGWVGVVCPWCGVGTGKAGLGIHLESGAASCWKCGRRSLTDVLHELTGKSVGYCLGFVKGLRREPAGARPEHTGKYTPPKTVGPLLRCHGDYLRSRGFEPKQLERVWGIGGIGLDPKLAWRVFIPAVYRDRPASWTTRATSEGASPKYRSARPEEESVPLKAMLYGEHYCRHAVVAVEGPIDVWAVGPGAAGTCGVVVTRAQVVKLAKFPVRAVCFDSEPEAQRRARALCDQLRGFPGKTERVELDAKDPGSAPAKELRLLRKAFLD